MSEVPLRRNRDFVLLQAGQLLSSAGSAPSATAYPLLVPPFTHSPPKAGLAGPPLGGALFGVARALPFVADVISYVFSVGTVAAMRTPFQEERDVEPARIRAQIAEGFRFLWRHPFLRTVALIFSFSNFV